MTDVKINAPLQNDQFWSQYAAQTALELNTAAYTKVSPTWRDEDFVPGYSKFYYIIEGSGFLKKENELLYPQPGELYLLPAGVRQSYGTLDGHNTFGKFWCHFTAEIGEQNLFQLLKLPLSIRPADPAHVERQFRRLITHGRGHAVADKFAVKSILFDLLALYIAESPQISWRATTTASEQAMRTVLSYIQEHLAETMTIEELARMAHFNANYFIQVFKDFTGRTPIQYINRMRLEKARQLLQLTDAPISRIAEQIGMELGYFSRIFKEHTGFSPKAYRDLRSPEGDA